MEQHPRKLMTKSLNETEAIITINYRQPGLNTKLANCMGK
jgi:hypothetical protein